MAIAGGVDGCRGGWLCVTRDSSSGQVEARVLFAIQEVLMLHPRPGMVAVDIPIGLTDRGPRLCDREARSRLGRPRGSSVFPAPIRPVLAAGSHEEACRIGRAVEGRALSIEAWGIVPKIRQVDAFLSEDPSRQGWLREAHPELSFWCGNGRRPMGHNKKTAAGRQEREALIVSWFGDALAAARAALPRGLSAPDDLLDAFATLWTAERLISGIGHVLPSEPPRDERGLRMEICV
jgi:predicted RNase H-like nuclease